MRSIVFIVPNNTCIPVCKENFIDHYLFCCQQECQTPSNLQTRDTDMCTQLQKTLQGLVEQLGLTKRLEQLIGLLSTGTVKNGLPVTIKSGSAVAVKNGVTEAKPKKHCLKPIPGATTLFIGVDSASLDLFPTSGKSRKGFKELIIEYTCSLGYKRVINGEEFDIPDQVGIITRYCQ